MHRRSVGCVNGIQRLAAVASLVCALALVGASSTLASVTIGQLPETTPTPSCPNTPTDYLQPSVTSGELYIAREAGTIVSWSTRASATPDQDFVPKVFRRTADPDVFQVVEHGPPVTLEAGILNTFPVSLPVRSGDMLGFNAGGAISACTSEVPGDRVLSRLGDLPDGQPGTFAPKADSRLNLSAVLVPSNDFTVTVKRDHQGKAAVTAFTSNPGVVSLSGKGLRSGRAAKSVFVAGPVHFQVTAAGRRSRRLARRGKVSIRVTVTFAPTSGDPRSQQIMVRLRKRRTLGVI